MAKLKSIVYKGAEFSIENLREKILGKGFNPQNPLSVRQLYRYGLKHPVNELARANSISAEDIIGFLGFATYRSATYYTEKELRQLLLDYNRGSKTTPINVRAMYLDRKHGGSSLAPALAKFAQSRLKIARTASRAIEHFGFHIMKPRRPLDSIKNGLRALWPKEKIAEVYQGNGTLPDIGNLKQINSQLYSVLQKQGIVSVINSLYEEFPDLYTYVRSAQSPVGQADAEILKKQLWRRFLAGRSISHGLSESPDENERALYSRVMSLPPSLFGSTFSEIVHHLLPELSMSDIKGNTPEIARRNGVTGNLLTEWLLRWTLVIDPAGKAYGQDFQRIFQTPFQRLYAEKNIAPDAEEILRPDFLLIGRKNTAIEVKSGENVKTPVNLMNKYDPTQGYFWLVDDRMLSLENLVAVLHMPNQAVNQVSGRLADAGYYVIGGERFLGMLETFLKSISTSPWQEQFAQAAPRVHSMSSIKTFYEQFAFKPATFYRPSNSQLGEHMKETLEALVNFELKAA